MARIPAYELVVMVIEVASVMKLKTYLLLLLLFMIIIYLLGISSYLHLSWITSLQNIFPITFQEKIHANYRNEVTPFDGLAISIAREWYAHFRNDEQSQQWTGQRRYISRYFFIACSHVRFCGHYIDIIIFQLFYYHVNRSEETVTGEKQPANRTTTNM